MFGKGVYFADMSSKSANYCFVNRTKNTGLLLLCEVACGKQNERFEADSMLHLHQPKVGVLTGHRVQMSGWCRRVYCEEYLRIPA